MRSTPVQIAMAAVVAEQQSCQVTASLLSPIVIALVWQVLYDEHGTEYAAKWATALASSGFENCCRSCILIITPVYCLLSMREASIERQRVHVDTRSGRKTDLHPGKSQIPLIQ